MTTRPCVVVFGASGFVGGAVAQAVENAGATVLRRPAPRLTELTESEARRAPIHFHELVAETASSIPAGCPVVNAAGLGDATNSDEGALMAANCGVAAILAAASAAQRVRFVHVSSAAVQGRRTLDASDRYAPFSAYSRSKVAGELAVRQAHPEAVVYRPPGVHGANRAVTRSLARLARSRFSAVAAPGTDNAAQALVENVADACVYLALSSVHPPTCVSHPSEGLTTATLLTALGGRPPIHLPRALARVGVGSARLLASLSTGMAAHTRRLESLWFGQLQETSWLTTVGWQPAVDVDGWHELGKRLNTEKGNG